MSIRESIQEARRIIWPIENHELKKFLPMGFMMFCILFNFTVLRALKDSLVVPEIGAEALSFLKLWGVLPAAVLAMLLYAELLSFFSEEKTFYIITGIFIAFFALFAFVLHPNAELIHPNHEKILAFSKTVPNFKWFILIFGKWSYALFYIFAELWGSLMVSLLFWQFANKITTTVEAKRFYTMFGVIGNLALIAAGELIGSSGKQAASIAGEVSASSDLNLTFILSIIIVAALFCMFFYYYMNAKVLTDPRFYSPKVAKKSAKKKLTMKESFNLIMHSKYLGLIAVIVLCYGISINLVEGPWKAKIRQLYPTQNEYLQFMGPVFTWIGVGTIISYIIGSNVLRKCSWLTAALFTPVMLLLTGLGFFIFSIFNETFNHYAMSIFGTASLVFAVHLGMIQNVLSKATKYSLFDPTKEMAYIPIDNELKTRGKAAVDVVGGRLGKSGGALIQFALFSIFPNASFETISPYLMVLFALVSVVWMLALVKLNREYLSALDNTEQEVI